MNTESRPSNRKQIPIGRFKPKHVFRSYKKKNEYSPVSAATYLFVYHARKNFNINI